MNASPHEVATTMMTSEEARKRVTAINAGMNNLRAQIIDFHDREGWKALGYDSWTACVESEFEVGRRQIFYQLKAAQVEKNINDSLKSQCNSCTESLPERTLRPLTSLPPEDQAPAYQLAKETAPEGKVTARHVEKVVREIKGEPVKRYIAPRTYAPGSLMKDISGVNTDVAYFVDLAIRSIDKIKDTDPGCKEALAKIAVHLWNRQHGIKAAL